MKHLIFFSGGAGSYATTKRVLEKVDKEDVHLLFTDTLIEDKELYRFMLDAFEKIYGVDLTEEKNLVADLAEVEDNFSLRKDQLKKIQKLINDKLPNVHWLRYEVNGEGIDPWAIFYNDMFIGNSRLAKCSHLIKQRLAKEYVKQTFNKDDLVVYLGIDWSESHRVEAPTRNWLELASDVCFPMTEAPYLTKIDIIKLIEIDGIKIPKPYLSGAPHLNCGGFCVRGGQGHFARLYELNPKLYEYHAKKERDLANIIREKRNTNEEYSILKQKRDGVTYSLTLDQLRQQLEGKKDNIDMFDIGGCGCFVTDDNEEYEPIGKWGLKELKLLH